MRELLVCDLDNTLYDWVSYFVPSFYAMVDSAVDCLGCDREKLLDELQHVHRLHRDVEHPFALLETSIVQIRFAGLCRRETYVRLERTFDAFSASRDKTLCLYDGVAQGAAELVRRGVRIVAHTEGKTPNVIERIVYLGLTDHISRVYCQQRSAAAMPHPLGLNNVSLDPAKIVELSHHQAKPNADVLVEICAREKVPVNQAAYLGDSLTRDMLMAKRANVLAIWAKYGCNQVSEHYERLVRISHWGLEEIAREKAHRFEASDIQPDFVASECFSQVLSLFAL